MINKILRKYRAEGVSGVLKASFHSILRHHGPMIHPVQVALNELMNQDSFVVVQIGAFVGNTPNDPLYKTLSRQLQKVNGTLIVVEPVTCFFQELVKSYQNIPGVFFENVAIADHNGTAKFYRIGVDPSMYGFSSDLCQLGSLKEKHMEAAFNLLRQTGKENLSVEEFCLKHKIEETVNCITFAELMRRHNLSRIDLLQIDAEGYDFEILKMVDFQQCPVRFVNFEHALLEEQRKDAMQLMRKNGYTLVNYGFDTFCYKKADKHISKRWR